MGQLLLKWFCLQHSRLLRPTPTPRAIFEFVYEKNYWSDYRELDFEYSIPLTGALASFDTPVEKNYRDTNTYRFGLSYFYRPKLAFMFGFGIDESPVPESTLNFELPDADALIYSTGFKYHSTEKMPFALTYPYPKKKVERLLTQIFLGNLSPAQRS